MGKRIFRSLMIGMCLVALATLEASAATSRSAVGTWKLNVSRSSYGNMPGPKYEKLVVTTDQPDAVKWLLTGATGDGKTFVSMYNGPSTAKPSLWKQPGRKQYRLHPDGGRPGLGGQE